MTSSDQQLLVSSPIYKGVRRHNSCAQIKKESGTNAKSTTFLRSVRELRSHGTPESPHWGDLQTDTHSLGAHGSRRFRATSSWHAGMWAWDSSRGRIPANPAFSLLPDVPAGSRSREAKTSLMLRAAGGQLMFGNTQREFCSPDKDMSPRKTVLTEPEQHRLFQSLTNGGGEGNTNSIL